MRRLFTKNSLVIALALISKDKPRLVLSIQSDYSQSDRKSRLYVDDKKLAQEIESFWKQLKSKLIQSCAVGFFEIDYYDDLTNIYTTPVVTIGRGKRKAAIRHDEHGSIPKDWAVNMHIAITPTRSIGPIQDILTKTVGGLVTEKQLQSVEKEFRKVLQGKTSAARFELEHND